MRLRAGAPGRRTSNLSSGAKYQIAFNHYEIHPQHVLNTDRNTIRWNENSRDIKGLIAFFTNTLKNDSIKPSQYDAYVQSSKYFRYDNPVHGSSQFQIGSVKMPQNVLNSTDCYLELRRAVPSRKSSMRGEVIRAVVERRLKAKEVGGEVKWATPSLVKA